MTFGVMSPDSKDALYDCHIIFPINKTIRKMNFGDSIPSLGNESKFPQPKFVRIVIAATLIASFTFILSECNIFHTNMMQRATTIDEIKTTIHVDFLNGLTNT